MMGYILDIILILIVAVCVFLAVRKGFVRSLIEVIGYVLAVIIAFSASGLVAEYLYDNAIEPNVITLVSSNVEESTDAAFVDLPDYLVSFLEKTDVDLKACFAAGDANEIAQRVSDVVEPVAVNVVKTIASVIIFLILLVAVNILARLLNSVFKGAILGTANKFLGAVLGCIKGIVLASIFCLLVYFIANISTKEILFFSEDAINNSIIGRYIIDLLTAKI